MAQWHYDSEQNCGRLEIDGDLTVSEVASLKERILEAFDQAGAVTIDLSASGAVDIAGVQLLCASHRYAEKRRQTLTLRADGNPSFLELVRQAGMARSFSCEPANGENCLLNEER